MKEKKLIEAFRREITIYRTIKGISQARLANMVGVTRFTIINYELGKRVPDICTGLRIARILEIDLEKMMEKT